MVHTYSHDATWILPVDFLTISAKCQVQLQGTMVHTTKMIRKWIGLGLGNATGLQWHFPLKVFPDFLRGLRHALGTSAQGDQCCSGIEGYGLMAWAGKSSASSKKAAKQSCSKLGPHPWLSGRCAKNWNDLGNIFPECSWLRLKDTCQCVDLWSYEFNRHQSAFPICRTCHISLEYVQAGGSQHH